MCLRVIVLLTSLLISQTALANWSGSYLNVSQTGMGVELSAQNEYVLYIVQNEQATPIDFGMFNASENQIQFTSAQTQTLTSATIIQEGCGFIWGEAGEFRSTDPACNNTNNQPNVEGSPIPLISVNNFTLTIPQLGMPDGYGGMLVLKADLQLTAMNPIQFTLASVEAIANPANILSAVYMADTAILYLPVIRITNEMSGESLDIYEVVLNLAAFDPYVVFVEYPQQPIQAEPPTTSYTPEYNPEMYDLLSDINNMEHETSMNIINNIGGVTECYDYSYDCQYY